MGVLTPFVRAFSGVKASLGAISLLALILILSNATFPLAGWVALVVLTPAVIEAVLNGPHSVGSAFRASNDRILRYFLWLLGTGAVIVATILLLVVIAVAGSIWNWTVTAGLAYVGGGLLALIVLGFFASLLTTAAAAGLPSAWGSVKGAIFSRRGPKSLATLILLWLMTAGLGLLAGLSGVTYAIKSGIDGVTGLPEVFYNVADALPNGGIMWFLTALFSVLTAIATYVIAPSVVAAVLGAPIVTDDTHTQ